MPDTTIISLPEPQEVVDVAIANNIKTESSQSQQQTQTESTQQPPPPQKVIVHNPRWNGYCYVAIFSLVNFCAISNVPEQQRQDYWYLAICFGVLTFVITFLILAQDWTQRFTMIVEENFMKLKDGYVEGYTLCFMVIWWIIGVAYQTRPGGIAYVASNIYYSSWLSLFSGVYTLNQWSISKDILSLAEIVSISQTLKYWWLLFLGACIVFGNCVDVIIRYNQPWNSFDDARYVPNPKKSRSWNVFLWCIIYRLDNFCIPLNVCFFVFSSFGLALGLASMAISFLFILIHYDFLSACECEEGGWAELFTSFFLILIWIIGLSIL
jgi:hypothetical protein